MFSTLLEQIRPPERRQEILLDLGEIFPDDGIARDQHQFDRLGEIMLVLPETFAQQPPRAAAHHRAADFPAGNHTESWRRAARQCPPVGNQTTERESLSLQSDARKITLLLEPRRPAQLQSFRYICGHEHAN